MNTSSYTVSPADGAGGFSLGDNCSFLGLMRHVDLLPFFMSFGDRTCFPELSFGDAVFLPSFTGLTLSSRRVLECRFLL